MKLFKMAMGNVKKYWRHYLIVGIFVLLGTIFLLSKTMISETDYQTRKQYDEAKYGSWFVSLPKDRYDAMLAKTYSCYSFETNDYYDRLVKDAWDDLCKKAGDYEYTYVYEQGKYNDYLIGYIDSMKYHLFGIHILEGKDKQANNEVMISKSLSDKEGIQIGDLLQIESIEEPAIVAGIFENYNEQLPEIITNIDEGVIGYYYSNNSVVNYDVGFQKYRFTYYTYIGGSSVGTTEELDYTINPHGYDGKDSNVTFDQNFNKLQSFVQMILLLALVISVLTTTSLKRRAKESTLLRGIGATASQLIMLTIDEMSIILAFTTIIGYIISYGILRYYGTMKTKIYGFYYYHFSKPLIIAYCIGIIITIIFITFLPMRSSAIGALTGAFEAPKPKMLEGRESKWVSQTSRVMAKRNLRAYSKLTLALTIFVTIIGGYFITYRAALVSTPIEQEVSPYNQKGYYHIEFNHQEDVDEYLEFFHEEDELHIVPVKDVPSYTDASIAPLQDDFVSIFELKEGRYPEKSHEILINDQAKIYDKIYYIHEHDIEYLYGIKPIFVNNQPIYDYYQDDLGNIYYYDEQTGEFVLYTEYYDNDYIIVDGKIIKHYGIDVDEKGYTKGYIIYDQEWNEVERYDVDDPALFIEYDQKNSFLLYRDQLYSDYYYQNMKPYARVDKHSGYFQVTGEYSIISDYLKIDGNIVINFEKVYDENHHFIGVATFKNAAIGDSILINDEKYQITGIIPSKLNIKVNGGGRWNSNYEAYSNNHIYILEDDFSSLEGKESYHIYSIFDYGRKDELTMYNYNHFQKDDTFVYPLFNSNIVRQNIIDASSFDGTYFIILVVAGIILCLFLNLNSMLNDIKNYAILHLLGMSNDDIIKMHVHMALEMSLRVIILVAIYFVFLMVGFKYTIDLLSIIIVIAGVLVFFMCVYLIPAIYMTKTNLMETLMGEE